MSDVLSSATAFAADGFPVLPIALRGKDKRPLIKGWPELATLDPAQIQKWWVKDFPHAGVAIVTGSRSRLITIDVDCKSVDGFPAFRKLGLQHLERVPTVLTQSNGNHFHYRLPPGRIVLGGANKLGAGIDIRAENNCIVMPPSQLDPRKPPYAWVNGVRLSDAPPLPSDIMAMLEKKRDKTHAALEAAADSIRRAPPKGAHDLIVTASWEIAGHILSGKLSRAEVLDAFLVAAAERGHDKIEVEDAVSSALRKRGIEGGTSAGAKVGGSAYRTSNLGPNRWMAP